ncbi:MAG: MFS transporter [Acidimicrobiales bacterium]
MKLLTDTAPLRESRQFRLLFIGRTISVAGSQFTVVAAPFQVFDITDSTLMVGLLALAQLPPLLVASFLGGTLADAFDRRRILIVTQLLLALASVGLALNATLAEPQLWVVFVLTSVIAALSGIDSPTRTAVVPTLVTPAQLPSALALNQLSYQIALVVGPALAGLVITQSIAAAYWVDVVTFSAGLVALLLMLPMVPLGGGTPPGWRSAVAGWRYLRSQPAVEGAFVIDLNAMVFGMPRTLFPELATRVFNAPGAVGLLYAAPAVGAFIGAATSGWINRIDRQGKGVLVSVILWGGSIALFGFSPWLWLALVLLAVAGWADVISAVMRNTIIMLTVPDELRGRLSALHIANVTGGPRLGDVESGAVAAATSVRVSAWSGGLACVLGVGVVARAYPALRGWRLSDHSAEVEPAE